MQLAAHLMLLAALLHPRKLRADETATDSGDVESARKARYYFYSEVEDQENDLSIHRQEQREGHKVKGSYGYSDGFHKRYVSYEADQNGYRVIRDEIQPLPGRDLDNSTLSPRVTTAATGRGKHRHKYKNTERRRRIV